MRLLWILVIALLAAIIFFTHNPPGEEQQPTEQPGRQALQAKASEQDTPIPASASPAEPFNPNVVAQAFITAPGALVCPDLRAVEMVRELYNQHWKDSMYDAATHGQSVLLRGKTPEVIPSDYNCWLLAPGTPMEVKQGYLPGLFPATAKLADGTMIHGVTGAGMFAVTAAPAAAESSGRSVEEQRATAEWYENYKKEHSSTAQPDHK
jgi:hypothetical protein